MFTVKLNIHSLSAHITTKHGHYTSYLAVYFDSSVAKRIADNRGLPHETLFSYCLKISSEDTLARWQTRARAVGYVGEDAIDRAEYLLRRLYYRTIPRLIRKGESHPAYTAMRKEFLRVVQHYRNDFYYHDALILGLYWPTEFLWGIRNTGTHIRLDHEGTPIADLKRYNQEVWGYSHGSLQRIDK